MPMGVQTREFQASAMQQPNEKSVDWYRRLSKALLGGPTRDEWIILSHQRACALKAAVAWLVDTCQVKRMPDYISVFTDNSGVELRLYQESQESAPYVGIDTLNDKGILARPMSRQAARDFLISHNKGEDSDSAHARLTAAENLLRTSGKCNGAR